MTNVERIEKEIRDLTREEREALREWFLSFDADAWDREIEADVQAGKLDGLADEALEANRTGRSTPI